MMFLKDPHLKQYLFHLVMTQQILSVEICSTYLHCFNTVKEGDYFPEDHSKLEDKNPIKFMF